jgi:signal peptidase
MSPTLKPLDVLRVVAYDGRSIRPGDVVVFRHPDCSHKVVHRVVSVSAEGVRTRGDNCMIADTWVLNPGSILGCVSHADRGKKRVRIYGGNMGRLCAFGPRLRLWARSALYYMMRPVYLLLARSGVGRRLVPIQAKTRIVCFKRASGVEIQLLLGRRAIATRYGGTDRWIIRPPFRLFIDEKSLPG